MRALLIAAAGAAGALARWGLFSAVGTRSFPWGTLAINLAGCAAIGFVLGGPAARWSPTTTTAVAVGFLGSFTTFSTFAFEGTALLRDDRPGAALAYVGGSVALGLAAAAAGWMAGRAA